MLCITPAVFCPKSDLLNGVAFACFQAWGNLVINAGVIASGIISLIGGGFFSVKTLFTECIGAGGAGCSRPG